MSQTVPIPHGLPMERDAGPFDPPRQITRLREARPVSPLIFPDGHEGWLVTPRPLKIKLKKVKIGLLLP